MKFPGAPHGLKMACGENPKRVYGGKGRAPSTRMGNVAGYRQAFADAQDYRRQCEKYERELADYEAASPADGKGSRRKGDDDAKPPCRRSATCASRRWPPRWTARSWCTSTATAPTRWP